jgi:hypothetical protein
MKHQDSTANCPTLLRKSYKISTSQKEQSLQVILTPTTCGGIDKQNATSDMRNSSASWNKMTLTFLTKKTAPPTITTMDYR